jgi:DNA polymerase III delta prime subunit
VPTEGDGLGPLARRKAGKPSLNKPTKASNKTKRVSSKTAKESSAELLEVDPNLGRRKRQKSGSPEDESLGTEGQDYSEGNIPRIGDGHNGESETTVISADTGYYHDTGGSGPQRSINPSTSKTLTHSSTSSASIRQSVIQSPTTPIGNGPLDTESSAMPNYGAEVSLDPQAINFPGPTATKPQKTLRLNPNTGTIGSPPTKKPVRLSNGTGTKRKPGKASTEPKSLIVTIKYGHDRDTRSLIGQNIDDVLCGVKSSFSLQKPSPEPPKSLPPARPSKSTHPFFLGKAVPKVLISDHAEKIFTDVATEGNATRLKSSITLGEAKSRSPASRQIQASGNVVFQNFGNTTKIMKFPGAVDACWPPKELVHIRGPAECTSPSGKLAQVAALSTQKKSKYTATETLAKDDILKVIAMKLSIDDVLERLKCANVDDFAQPERALRVPVKHFENGFQIQRRVRRELSVQLPLISTSENLSDSEDELHNNGKKSARVNPALLKIYKSLPSSLTAFDRSQYETQSWIHKYSPCTAAEVLQCGKEPFILQEWLQSLTITAVDLGATDSARSRAVSVASRRSGVSNAEKSGKKKRKANKLEGFVISSEEEDDEMDEISDPEEDIEASYRLTKKTVIRSGDTLAKVSRDAKKLKNAVVISGPSGCGKTAMVYGVAKELGFEIFEINSSSRRSGKDILERVGDMTRNHLVHRSDHAGPSDPQDEDIQRISDALSADLKSGRQGTMNSFFKPKKSTNSAIKNTILKPTKMKDAIDEAPKPSKAPPKQQKQSLILFEEVDVLFEEDKQFWTTVMNLIAQSKRPIIMTCNDETLLPLQALELHAIIRLSPPPSDVAIDYMLLVAAAEGHVIKRRAVKALYEARQCDLRAALTELDYWCQLGVGDRKGGLDWFYPRWPPGCDIDEHGHTIRVVSEGTYKTGMGWLGRDFIFERLEKPDVKEEVLREAWDGWNIDIGDWHEFFEIASLLEETTGDSRVSALSSYEAFAQAMSVSDVCACSSLATGNQVSKQNSLRFVYANTTKVLLDTGSPLVTAKARDDFIIGYELLQADALASYDTLNKEIAIWIKSQARELLQADNQARFKAPSEAQISAKIASLGCRQDGSICRQDFSIAFDPIAESERNTLQIASSLEHSVFYRTTSMIAVDVAPYVRSIVAYDAKLQQERARLSNLLSEGGRKGKRLRTTRSALSALEGGARKTTRSERYFRVPLNPHMVNRTGLQGWQDAVSAEMSETETRETPSALDGLEGSSPAMTDSS